MLICQKNTGAQAQRAGANRGQNSLDNKFPNTHKNTKNIKKYNEKLTLLLLLLLMVRMLPRHAECCPNKEAEDEHVHLHLASVNKIISIFS